MKKLIFLDVDGVLNDLNVLSTREELGFEHLQNLKFIISATSCEIVLSSSWRILEEWKSQLKLAFEEHKIPLWVDETPQLRSENFSIIPRREEIILWLKNNVSEDALVAVIDDENDANINGHDIPNIKDKFFQTCMNKGLTSNHSLEIINFFKT